MRPQPFRKLPPNGKWWKWVASATAIALVASLAALWHFTRPSPRPPIRFDVELGSRPGYRGRVAISPDGSRIAFVGRDATGKSSLLTRRLDQAKATVLDDSLGRGYEDFPFFSPDSKWIGYGADHHLKKVSVEGGLPVAVADGLVASGESTWGDNGEIVSQLTFTGLSRIPPGVSLPRPFPIRYSPSFLPGGKTILVSGRRCPSCRSTADRAKPIGEMRGDGRNICRLATFLSGRSRDSTGAPLRPRRMAAKGPPVPSVGRCRIIRYQRDWHPPVPSSEA